MTGQQTHLTADELREAADGYFDLAAALDWEYRVMGCFFPQYHARSEWYLAEAVWFENAALSLERVLT